MAVSRWYQWECVVWKESLPEDGLDALVKFGVTGYISPVHNDAEDEEGHPHYHWILCFPTSKSYQQVMQMMDDEGLRNTPDHKGPVNTVKYVKDLNLRKRYLCHLDEKHKQHYSPEDVICIGGAEYDDCLHTTPDKQNDDLSIIELIKKYNCTSYAQLVEYCLYCDREHYRSIVGRCGFWSAYLRSRSQDSKSRELEYIINEKRGKKDGST